MKKERTNEQTKICMNDWVNEWIISSPRARGGLFVLKGPYDPRAPPIVKFSQESESARLTKIIPSKSTVKPFKH